MQLPFGEWLPDQPNHLKQGANIAKNVYHAKQSYKPVKSLVPYSSNTILSTCLGAGSFRDGASSVFNFASSQDTIYQLTSGAFTDRGAGGLLLTTAKASCTITVSDYGNIGAGKTLSLTKNDGTIIVFTSTAGTASGTLFKVETNNNTTAANLKTTINAHADFTATVADAVVTVTRAAVGRDNLTVTSSDTTRLTSTNFTGGTPLTGDSTDYITFTQFGNYIIVSNGVDAPQYYLMGTSTNFANLSAIATEGTPPVFRVSGVIRDFLVTGNLPSNTNRVQWSGINDITTWTSGKKLADYQDLPGSGGQIVHITSGEVGYIFRQNQIIRMDFVGGATVFRFSVISSNRGAVYGRTVTQNDRNVFFYSDDGFYQISGDTLIPIGAEKVNRYFDNDLNKAYTDRISAAVDPFNQLAIWSYVSKRSTDGNPDSLMIYNYVTKKWTFASISASTIFTQFFGAYTVETMDVISENLEDLNISLDTDFWSGGQLYLGAINSDFKAAIFSGTPLEAELETDEIEGKPGVRLNITGVRPIIDADTTVTIKSREKLSDTATESVSGTTNNSGVNPVRSSGRYIRANVKVSAGVGWNDAQGIDIIASQAGTR
jgi:hypothetical protein